jgi:hypothetical protein
MRRRSAGPAIAKSCSRSAPTGAHEGLCRCPQVLSSSGFALTVGFARLGGGSDLNCRGAIGIAQRQLLARGAVEGELGERFPSELRVWTRGVEIGKRDFLGTIRRRSRETFGPPSRFRLSAPSDDFGKRPKPEAPSADHYSAKSSRRSCRIARSIQGSDAPTCSFRHLVKPGLFPQVR